MLTYEETMAHGRAQYQDVLDALAGEGLPTEFIQTGGMNAALQVSLDGGWSLLVTDAEDSLSWARSEQRGWGVGLYAPEHAFDGECRSSATTPDGSLSALRAVIEEVLRCERMTPRPPSSHGGCTQGPVNPIGRGDRVLVLPHPDHRPPGISQACVGVPVTGDVVSELVGPPSGVVLRPGGVYRTGVPEAAVDVDGHARPGEEQVGPASHPLLGGPVHEESTPATV